MDSNKLKHLEFIQGVVNRMAANSFSIKGWYITVFTGVIAAAIQTSNHLFLLLSFIPLFLFWGLDSYYLQQEKRFRILYEKVAFETESEIDFSMDKGVRPQIIFNVAISKTIAPLYLIPVIIILAIYLWRMNIMNYLTIQSGLALTGAILSLEGTGYMVLGQVFEKIDRIVLRHLNLCGYNGEAIKADIDQKIKSSYGLALVFLGSVIQVISITIPQNSGYYYPIWLMLAAGIVPIVIYFFYIKRKIKIAQKLAIIDASNTAEGRKAIY